MSLVVGWEAPDHVRVASDHLLPALVIAGWGLLAESLLDLHRHFPVHSVLDLLLHVLDLSVDNVLLLLCIEGLVEVNMRLLSVVLEGVSMSKVTLEGASFKIQHVLVQWILVMRMLVMGCVGARYSRGVTQTS